MQEIYTEEFGEIPEGAITLGLSGQNGEGIANLSLDAEYVNLGYHIEYQVGVTVGSTWIAGNKITGLQNGDKIYASIYDGVNRSSNYFTFEVADLEQFEYYIDTHGNSTENKTVAYTDTEENTAYIPKGFKVGTTSTVNKISNGLVIKDTNGNEFVWVPVETAIETDTSKTSTEKAIARYQNGYSASTTPRYYEGISYTFSGTSSTKRSSTPVIGTSNATYAEPRLVTGGADYTWNIAKNSAKGSQKDALSQYYQNMNFGATSGVNAFNNYTEFGSYMNQQYTNMVQSVDYYGGFYVGRYETSISTVTSNKTAIAQIQSEKTPIYNQTWWQDYYYQDSNIDTYNPYYSNTSVTSSMIWGSQWDAILNWMLKDEKTASFVTAQAGNHTGSIAKTGNYPDDLAKNIFDLSSNVAEWTQGSGSGNVNMRERRGGYAVTEGDTYYTYSASSYVGDDYPDRTYVISNKGSGQVNLAAIGTRMQLYINNEEDTTAPNLTIDSVEQGTNNINIKVTGVDNESGIQKYVYTLYSDPSYNTVIKQENSYSANYTAEGLTQNQTYYVKVQAVNGKGLTADVNYGAVLTDALDVQEGTIVREKTWGKDGDGKIYCTMNDKDLANEGYYLEYQNVSSTGTFNVNGTWTKGDTPSNLSVGDTVYLRLSDGINNSTYYMTVAITELETFTQNYTQTATYTDSEGNTATIPAGFKRATSEITNKISTGLVIEDDDENQYVWIPVKHAIYNENDGTIPTNATTASQNASSYKPMAKYQNGYDENSEEQYFEGIVYDKWAPGYVYGSYAQRAANSYALGNNSYREPTLITGSSNNLSWVSVAGSQYDAVNYTTLSQLGITSPTTMGRYLNDSFTEAVQSIDEFGGFYIGRYETSIFTSTGANNSSQGTIVGSKKDQTPMASINWYKMYLTQDSNYENNPYYGSSSVRSQMIWGSEWDAALNYILEGTESSKVYAKTGNRTGSRAGTAKFGSDIMNNIFDLSSNVVEWSAEGSGATYRVSRGGSYHNSYPASYRSNYYYPTSTNYDIGYRLTLLIRSSGT